LTQRYLSQCFLLDEEQLESVYDGYGRNNTSQRNKKNAAAGANSAAFFPSFGRVKVDKSNPTTTTTITTTTTTTTTTTGTTNANVGSTWGAKANNTNSTPFAAAPPTAPQGAWGKAKPQWDGFKPL